MSIRPAVPADAEQVSAILSHYIRNTVATFNSVEKSVQDIATAISVNPAYFVANEGDKILGFATYTQFRGGIGYAHTMEHTIHLHPDAVGRGIGTELMSRVEEEGKRSGVHSLWAGVSAENAAGVAFHASLGFQTQARLPEVGYKFGRWLDLILMAKFL